MEYEDCFILEKDTAERMTGDGRAQTNKQGTKRAHPGRDMEEGELSDTPSVEYLFESKRPTEAPFVDKKKRKEPKSELRDVDCEKSRARDNRSLSNAPDRSPSPAVEHRHRRFKKVQEADSPIQEIVKNKDKVVLTCQPDELLLVSNEIGQMRLRSQNVKMDLLKIKIQQLEEKNKELVKNNNTDKVGALEKKVADLEMDRECLQERLRRLEEEVFYFEETSAQQAEQARAVASEMKTLKEKYVRKLSSRKEKERKKNERKVKKAERPLKEELRKLQEQLVANSRAVCPQNLQPQSPKPQLNTDHSPNEVPYPVPVPIPALFHTQYPSIFPVPIPDTVLNPRLIPNPEPSLSRS